MCIVIHSVVSWASPALMEVNIPGVLVSIDKEGLALSLQFLITSGTGGGKAWE